LKKCGFCGEPIPEAFRFTAEEATSVEHKLEDLEANRRQRQLAEDAANKEGGSSGPIIIPFIM